VTKDSGDIVAVYLHWGKEMQRVPEAVPAVLAVAASRPVPTLEAPSPCAAGVRVLQGKLIAYSLGDFIFSSASHRPTVILRPYCRRQPDIGKHHPLPSIPPEAELVVDGWTARKSSVTSRRFPTVSSWTVGHLGPAMP